MSTKQDAQLEFSNLRSTMVVGFEMGKLFKTRSLTKKPASHISHTTMGYYVHTMDTMGSGYYGVKILWGQIFILDK